MVCNTHTLQADVELGKYEVERQIGEGNQYQYCNVVSVHCQDTNGSPVMCINLLVPIFPADRVLNLVNTNQSTTSRTSSIYSLVYRHIESIRDFFPDIFQLEGCIELLNSS